MADDLVRRHGVAAIPVSVFYAQPPDARYVRFCFCNTSATLWEYPVIVDVDTDGGDHATDPAEPITAPPTASTAALDR